MESFNPFAPPNEDLNLQDAKHRLGPDRPVMRPDPAIDVSVGPWRRGDRVCWGPKSVWPNYCYKTGMPDPMHELETKLYFMPMLVFFLSTVGLAILLLLHMFIPAVIVCVISIAFFIKVPLTLKVSDGVSRGFAKKRRKLNHLLIHILIVTAGCLHAGACGLIYAFAPGLVGLFVLIAGLFIRRRYRPKLRVVDMQGDIFELEGAGENFLARLPQLPRKRPHF